MWGNGGRFYWGRKESGVDSKGIVVLFAWLSSEERNLKPYIDLYGSLGWNSLLCHVDFLTLFLPQKATSLASGVLNELVKEMIKHLQVDHLKNSLVMPEQAILLRYISHGLTGSEEEVNIRPLPIVLKSFSGGSKGCLYKVLQLVEGKCEGHLCKDKYQLVRDCICGQIYDSSPVDFTSDLGTRFVLHPSVLKMSHPPRVVSWMARGLASGLDTFFLDRFEAQRAEYWQTLYSSVRFGPFLIFCSEDDNLAPYHIVCNFAQQLQEHGGDVILVKWNSSPHVAHYKYHQADYKAAATEFFTKVSVVFSSRSQLSRETTANEGSCSKISEPVSNFHKAAVISNKSLAIEPSDDFFLPSSMEFNDTKETESLADDQRRDLFHLPGINPHGVLSQILYDVCVPKNIEGWDIKPGMSLNGRQGFGSSRRDGPFNPMKLIRRSRL